MAVITLHQLQGRTRHELISDEAAYCISRVFGAITVRRAERMTERRYPTHRRLRRAATQYFQNKGWDVLPHGLGVWGARAAMADLAIARGNKIVLVECLTRGWVNYANAEKKRRLEKFFPLWFVIEDPAVGPETSYTRRVERLAKRSRVFLWSQGKTLAPLFPRTQARAQATDLPLGRRVTEAAGARSLRSRRYGKLPRTSKRHGGGKRLR
jgi:hypothetical protein